jgi:glycosyltransferase involved in cell wall biosynthesis
MKICIISKFPPIQGGISAKTYWMAKGLAERGVEVHVITNANCVEEEYRIDDQSPELPANLTVHYVMPDIPWHIPCSELYIPRLLDKSLEIIGDNQIDLIDVNYLIPYGIVGYLLSNITGIPYVLRHGGSDIAKFLEQGVFGHLLPEVTRNASAIVTDDKNRNFFKDNNSNIYTLPRYVPDERYFKPAVGSHGIPTFAYIGKINH